ncbi:DNA polymerase III subunit beta [Pectinatus cerevisiiphilus]|uniref:Beta sliding clamp n=1 Tax=Pectinatus cerevisiiphilus TaxID=86956 RepID=A0A4R3KEU1_9FIRM|nr:DNA polymerase III subunit beta [Pectinatus cerevisiiphilus]TCS81876.1 DNA polymerase-3 subunit beta [Pectinatus cerevisiiphilus]
MNFICTKSDLLQAIQINIKAISSKPQMPILSGIYIHAEDNTLDIETTDYDIGIICKIQADVKEPGTIVLPGRYFADVIKTLPGDNIEISSDTEQNTINIKSNTAKFNLLSMSANEFPKIKKLESENNLSIRSNILIDLIKKTSFACATEMIRPVFTGCLLELNNAELTMAATNTHRLAIKKEIMDDNNIDLSAKFIIPAKILNDLAALLVADIPIDVNISYSHNQISFTYENIYIVSRLIEGQFPNYNTVIPPSFSSSVLIKTKELQGAIDRVSLISRSNQYNIITLAFDTDNLLLSSNNPEIGKAEENIDIKLNGQPMNISFNAKYILDILKYIDSENITFSFNTEVSPAAIKAVGDDMFIYVVTPVRKAV